jgi:hypothetical protein
MMTQSEPKWKMCDIKLHVGLSTFTCKCIPLVLDKHFKISFYLSTSQYLQVVVFMGYHTVQYSRIPIFTKKTCCYHLHVASGLCTQKIWSRSGEGGDGRSQLGQSGLQDYTVSKTTKSHTKKWPPRKPERLNFMCWPSYRL